MHPDFRWVGQSADGKTVLLHRFEGKFSTADYATSEWLAANGELVRCGAIVDVETTGLNKAADTVIEIGVRPFKFNRNTGELLEAGPGYSALQDPGKPLTDTVKRVTGLTDEMLAGKAIDWSTVHRMLSESHVIIAHNAAFDRPFLDRNAPVSATKHWACSLKQVDWAEKGFGSQKLDVLCIYHGFFTDAHRALNDADALLHLLSMKSAKEKQTYLSELLANARRPVVRITAVNSPFESKDLLKERGYGWDVPSRSWQKTIFKDDLSTEISWMESSVYQGDFLGRVEELALTDQFKQQP